MVWTKKYAKKHTCAVILLIVFISVAVLNIAFSVPWFSKWYYHFVTAFAVYVTINAATVFA